MRVVEIGGEAVELRGTALAPLTWYDAFHDDGLYDALVSVERSSVAGAPHLPMRDVLRVAWVFASDADELAGRSRTPFRDWVAAHPAADFAALRREVAGEAADAFFPSAVKAAEKAKGEGAGAASPSRGASRGRKKAGDAA